MAAFHLSSLFSDKAILCRRHEIRVFGEAEKGTELTVTLLSASGDVLGSDRVTERNGRFLALLPPQEAAMHCTLRVSDGKTAALACDIAIGDVYLAGGQSNMELELKDADDGPAAVRRHENVLVRYYNVPKYALNTPEADRANAEAGWREVRPGEGRDMSAAAYFFAMKLQQELNVPIGIIDCYWGGSSITCWMEKETLKSIAEGQRYIKEYKKSAGKKTMEQYLAEEKVFEQGMADWNARADQVRRERPGVTAPELNSLLGPFPWFPPVGPGSPYRPAGLAETMLRRIVPATLTGVLFYQGEEDTGRTECYDVLLKAFISQLRRQFQNPALPFLNVQLPMWIPAGGTDSGTWPRLRQAQQRVAQEVSHTDLAILIDQGEYDNIHPTNKRVVGERLFFCAMNTVYGIPAPEAPHAVSKYTRDKTLYIQLSAPVTANGQPDLLLEVAGQDGVFYPAEAELDGSLLRLSHPNVPRPVMARYAWTDYASTPFFSENGLPLAPFWLV